MEHNCGDPNGDGGIDISDTVAILSYLFEGLSLSCIDAADIGDNGQVNIADAVAIVSYLFRGGSPPQPPFPDCGLDPTDDSIAECVPVGACP